jgi:hypothetical protein
MEKHRAKERGLEAAESIRPGILRRANLRRNVRLKGPFQEANHDTYSASAEYAGERFFRNITPEMAPKSKHRKKLLRLSRKCGTWSMHAD